METHSHITIVSGGQTGVDRAALDFALQNNIPCKGWCPKGRIAEDGPIDPAYPLKETNTDDHTERTRANVRDAGGTVLIYLETLDEGSRTALQYCKSLGKPVYIINERFPANQDEFSGWLEVNGIKSLNMAGPRESNAPGVYDFAISSLETLLLA